MKTLPHRMTRWMLAIALVAATACSKSDDAPAAGGDDSQQTAKHAKVTIKVAAAASLANAFDEVAKAFSAETGHQVVLSPGASGKLAKQVIEGAPFDVFASADASWIDEAIEEDAALADTRTEYAFGRVVVWSEGDAPATVEAVAEPAYKKIALANPDHAPYGRAAREALEKLGVWAQVEDRVVYGSNVRQAHQFAQTGNTEVAFTALSLVIGQPGDYVLVDDSLHSPLAQVAIVTKRSAHPDAARAFIAYLESDAGHEILRRYGLLRRGEQLASDAN